jgi:hypothetical protein
MPLAEDRSHKPMKHPVPDSHDIFHQIKYYAIEIAATIVFLAWLSLKRFEMLRRSPIL